MKRKEKNVSFQEYSIETIESENKLGIILIPYI